MLARGGTRRPDTKMTAVALRTRAIGRAGLHRLTWHLVRHSVCTLSSAGTERRSANGRCYGVAGRVVAGERVHALAVHQLQCASVGRVIQDLQPQTWVAGGRYSGNSTRFQGDTLPSVAGQSGHIFQRCTYRASDRAKWPGASCAMVFLPVGKLELCNSDR